MRVEQRTDGRIVDADQRRNRAVTGSDFHQRAGIGDIGTANAAPLFSRSHTEKTELAKLAQNLRLNRMRFVARGGTGLQNNAGKLRGGRTDELLLICQHAEISSSKPYA